jgi:hypothetical protein
MRSALRATLFTAAFVVPACTEPLDILGPTPVDEGIVIYIHSGFRGTSQVLAADVANLGRVEGPCAKEDEESATLTWDDCVSSIKVRPGWGVTLYRDRDFRGASMVVTADLESLAAISGSCDGSFNDCVSSLRVYRLQP